MTKKSQKLWAFSCMRIKAMKAYNVKKFILVLRPFLGDAWKARRACRDTPGFSGLFPGFFALPAEFLG